MSRKPTKSQICKWLRLAWEYGVIDYHVCAICKHYDNVHFYCKEKQQHCNDWWRCAEVGGDGNLWEPAS